MNRRPPLILHDRRAVAALEFALLLPLLLLILVGFAESYIFVRSVAGLERTAFTLADLIARRNLVCDAGSTSDPNSLNTYLSGAVPLISQPLDLADHGEVIISGVSASPALGAMVNWQKTSVYTLPSVSSGVGVAGGRATLDGGIVPDSGGDTVITAEVYYDYDWFPLLRGLWPDAPTRSTLVRRAYFRARLGALTTLYTSATNASCPA